jgi:hypothetical protein
MSCSRRMSFTCSLSSFCCNSLVYLFPPLPGCKWEEKMLSQLRDCKDCVITSLVSTKVNDRNEVMASFCTLWKQYPVGAQIQIRTAPVRNNLHCNMSEKRYPLKQYTRVPVAVRRESCANCSESLGMRCVTGKRKIKVEASGHWFGISCYMTCTT